MFFPVCVYSLAPSGALGFAAVIAIAEKERAGVRGYLLPAPVLSFVPDQSLLMSLSVTMQGLCKPRGEGARFLSRGAAKARRCNLDYICKGTAIIFGTQTFPRKNALFAAPLFRNMNPPLHATALQ